jgi:hypothetical protein
MAFPLMEIAGTAGQKDNVPSSSFILFTVSKNILK